MNEERRVALNCSRVLNNSADVVDPLPNGAVSPITTVRWQNAMNFTRVLEILYALSRPVWDICCKAEIGTVELRFVDLNRPL